MNYFGFWSSFYQLLDPDPGGKFKCGYGSGSETLVYYMASLFMSRCEYI
jgi:hypothetical protein